MTTTSYTTGTITLTNGSAEIVGHGTGWATAAIIGGVIYPGAAGNALPFGLEPADDTHITADVPWMGATGTYAYALVRDTAPGRQAAANAQTLTAYIARLGNPALSALAALGEDMAADRLAYATGDGSMAWTGFSEAARVLLAADDAAAQVAALEAVPVTRTVNGKALTADVILSAADVGLGDVDNTRDNDKPVSAAQQAAFDALGGDLAKRIRFDAAQELTAAEKGQAVANIGGGVLAGFRNKIINGDFAINQRGGRNLAPGENMIVLDRWYVTNSTDQTVGVSQQAFAPGQTKVPGEPSFYLNLNFPIAPTSGTLGITQRIESVRTLAGKRGTVTAYTSGPSANGGSLTCSLGQNFGAGGAPSASVITNVPLNIATVYDVASMRRQGMVDLPPIAGKTLGTSHDGYVALAFTLTPRASGNYIVAHVSVVEGDATAEDDPFSPRHIQQEMALCQYYHRRINCGLEGYSSYAGGSVSVAVPFGPMRSVPVPTEVYVAGDGVTDCIVAIVGSAVWYKLVASGNRMVWRQSVVILENEL